MDNQEEVKLEQSALQPVIEADVRAEVIKEFELDETKDAARIDKITAKTVADRKKLSTAIGQKIKHRDRVKELEGGGERKPAADDKSKVANGLTPMDAIALMNAKVPQDDIEDVVEFAAFKKIPIAEALNASYVKTMLSEKAESRRIAEATSTGGGRRTATTPTNEALIEQASSGKIPEADSDIDKLAEARMAARKKR